MIRRVMPMLWLVALTGAATTVAGAQGLFRSTAPLEVTIVTELKALLRDRDSTKFGPHPATVTYHDSTGTSRSFAATLRTRGHFRRQARNCSFPPLKLEFERKAVQGMLFQGNANLKITTSCRPGTAEYEQYILAEYALYRAYQLVSPQHFRTRLARVTYHDSTNAMSDVTSWAFFIEDDKEVARRFRTELEESTGALFRDLDPQQLAITSLFEYMVANTDWSISELHNLALMRDTVGSIHPVAYDFDWSGAVNTRYAFPDVRLGIRVTTDRLYRGPCLTDAQWAPVFARFNAARRGIEAVYESIPSLDPQRKRSALAFLGEFYRIIGDPRAARRALESCLPLGN